MAHPLRVLDADSAAFAGVDEFGFDPDFTERVLPLFRFLHDEYWRVETDGVEHVPATGPALLAANHAGVIPWDGAMIRTTLWLNQQRPRHARMLVVNFAFAWPLLSQFLLKTGNVLAHPDNAQLLLEQGELVGVFPEGVKGATKRYRDRYRVRRFGRGGFVQIAIRTGAPIVPVAVIGGEEAHPVLFDSPSLGRTLGLPTLPLLGSALPLPSKWFISFGRPIDTASLGPDAADDQGLVLEVADEVRTWVQGRLKELLGRRTTPFF